MSAILHYVTRERNGGSNEYVVLEKERRPGGDHCEPGFYLCCVVDFAIRGGLDQDQWDHLPVDRPLAHSFHGVPVLSPGRLSEPTVEEVAERARGTVRREAAQ